MLACKIASGFGTNVECKPTSTNNWLAVKVTSQGSLTYTWEIDTKGINNGWGIVEDNPQGYIHLVVGSGSATYTLTVEDENGCTTSCTKIVTSLCEKENDPLNFALYPNPVQDILNVKFDKQPNDDVTIEVYNLVGTKMYANTFENKGKLNQDGMDVRIDFSRFPSQVYYVKIISKAGTTIKKVVLDK